MSQITNSGPTLATVAGSGPAAFGVVALAPFLLRRIMQGAANSFPADLQTPKDVLSPDELKRIEAIWQTTEWPEGTDAYAKAAFGRPFASYVERIRHLGLSGTLLIDAGCGAGEWSFAWATRFERVLGFDTAPERTSAAIFQKNRLNVPAVEITLGDIRNIPAADESADALYCNDVILSPTFLEPVLREIYRVLKAGGVCYLGLAGPTPASEQAKNGNLRLTGLGRRRIYNSLWLRHLISVVGSIRPRWTNKFEAATELQLGKLAAERACDAGKVSAAASEVGFSRTEWAPDGWLSLKPDGSIHKAPRDDATSGTHEPEGRLRAFEMLLWKPQKVISQEKNYSSTSPVEPTINARIGGTIEANWKLTTGKTTYWNAESRQFLLPIIESTPPSLTELEHAIITSRHVESTDGIRFATGAVYDRNHKLLPSFVDREAYETAEKKLMRVKNDPIVLPEQLLNAQVIRGRYVYLGIFRLHFGHFLLESLIRIWYLLKSDPDIKVIFHQYENIRTIPPFARYIFSLFDLTLDRIKVVTQTSVVEQLIVPESEFELRWKARYSFSDTFNELFDRSSRLFPMRPNPRNIYLTRRHLLVKRPESMPKIVANEADVETLFAERGFTIVAPENLPVHQQIAIAGGADQIAGLKGSALHLSLFSQRPMARIIQIGREQSINHTLIDGLKNMESHQILCKFTPADIGRLIDLEPVRAALCEM